jgi:FdhE protein
VAGSFLRNLFGGAKAPPSVEQALAELDRLAGERPSLQPVFAWLRELLPEMAIEQVPALLLTREMAQQKLASGIPLLRGEAVPFDWQRLRERWQRACVLPETVQPDSAAKALAVAVRAGRLPIEELADVVLAGKAEGLRQLVTQLELDPALVTTLLRHVLFPVFAGIQDSVAFLREGALWEQGTCPVCGSWPMLAEWRGLDQSRFLRCGLCAAGWEAARLWCPYCGNRDHERLGLLHSESEETHWRVAVCEECRGYVKTLTTLSAIPPLHLLIADAATLHLDLIAAQRGYVNPG